MRRTLALVFAIVLCAGCGWQLRGSGNFGLEMESLYVRADGAPAIRNEIIRQLAEAGITLAPRPQDAEVIVTLSREEFDSRVVSVDPDTGKVREYELLYHVNMRVDDPQGKQLLTDELLELEREYTFDETAVLGTFSQEQTVRQDIIHDAAESVIRRLQAVPKASTATAAADDPQG